MIFYDHDILRIWDQLERLEERLSWGARWGSRVVVAGARLYDSMGRLIDQGHRLWCSSPPSRVMRVKESLEMSAPIAKDRLVAMFAGIELSSIWDILIAICKDIALYWGSSVLAGGVMGGAAGAFGLGVGVVPGVAVGVGAGNQVGLWLLAFLGLKSLAEGMVTSAVDAVKCYQKGFKLAWGPTQEGQFGFSGLTSNACVAHGAGDIAEGHVIMVLAILTGLVAYLTMGRAGGDKVKAALLGEISQSKRLGPRITQWLQKNEEQLVKHPQLQPKPQSSGGAGKLAEEVPPPRPREAKEPVPKEEVPPPVMTKKKLPCFNASNLPQGSVPEFDRQLMGQENGINDMTVDEYLKGREAFKNGQTVRDSSVAKQARIEHQEKLHNEMFEIFKTEGLSAREADRKAAEKAAEKMKTLNALHNPDLIAAGKDLTVDFGDASVNKSIGAQWKSNVIVENGKTTRIDALDKAARKVLESDRAKVKMNAKLERCK